jgi:opacity protein-like surface antigen
MNQQKLTKRNSGTNRGRSTLQILLLVLFIPVFASPGLGQVTNRVKEQPESFLLSDDCQVQRQSLPTIDFDRLRSDEQAKDKDRRIQKQLDVAAHVNFKLDNSGSDREETHVEEPYSALSKVFLPNNARNSLFPRTVALEATEESFSSPQPDPDLSKFAFFIDAGAAFPHGDISFFLDPGFSLNAGLEYMITTQFSAVGTFGYHRFSTFFGGDASVYQLSGNGKFYFVDDSTRLRPFVNGGVGLYVTDAATTHFGGNIGAGVLYEVTPKFGIQGSYNFHAFTVGDGTRFSTVQGGVRFRF